MKLRACKEGLLNHVSPSQSPHLSLRRPFRLKQLVRISLNQFARACFTISLGHELITYSSSVLIFILTILLLSVDFYYLKNIAGRRLVGLRWWNEVNTSTGDSTWVFESAGGRGDNGNKTDSRFFWLALYVQPALWLGMAVMALIKLRLMWLSIIGKLALLRLAWYETGLTSMSLVVALILTITNTVAFSRCDKFSQASNLASSTLYSGGLARNVVGGMFSRLFSR